MPHARAQSSCPYPGRRMGLHQHVAFPLDFLRRTESIMTFAALLRPHKFPGGPRRSLRRGSCESAGDPWSSQRHQRSPEVPEPQGPRRRSPGALEFTGGGNAWRSPDTPPQGLKVPRKPRGPRTPRGLQSLASSPWRSLGVSGGLRRSPEALGPPGIFPEVPDVHGGPAMPPSLRNLLGNYPGRSPGVRWRPTEVSRCPRRSWKILDARDDGPNPPALSNRPAARFATGTPWTPSSATRPPRRRRERASARVSAGGSVPTARFRLCARLRARAVWAYQHSFADRGG